MTLPAHSWRRSARAVLSGVLLLGGLVACGGDEPASLPAPGDKSASLSAPEVFYVRPYGDKSRPSNETAFQLGVKGGAQTTTPRRLTIDVPRDSQDAVRLRIMIEDCGGSATHVTCEVKDMSGDWYGAGHLVPVAAKGSEAGDSGVLRITYTTADGKKLTASTRIVVGEPVVQVRTTALEDVPPGSDVAVPVVVRNVGEMPVEGLGLLLDPGDLEFRQRYANCRYPTQMDGRAAVCRLPEVRIDPGQAVVIRPSVRLRASKTRMYGAYTRRVWALDAGAGPRSVALEGGDFGDGPALEASPARPADLKGAWATGDSASETVRLDTGADFDVIAVVLPGSHGAKRILRVVVRNSGPGDPGRSTRMLFSPPVGSEVLEQPVYEVDNGEYGPYCESKDFTYICDVDELGPGKSRTFEFALRLREPGEGRVSLEDSESATVSGRFSRDPDPLNDTASVRILP
ncbi:hypothetical protein ACFYW9_15280 [Streptomyces sp. NPDC002698]|uniref:hypothetical protein n=1 Tax=Streptomyces sp. NPDC002698 TaxID=3364660 RepID=UPI0036B8D837